MDVDLIFKIAAIGIIVAVLNQLLARSGRDDQAMMTTIAGLIAKISKYKLLSLSISFISLVNIVVFLHISYAFEYEFSL